MADVCETAGGKTIQPCESLPVWRLVQLKHDSAKTEKTKQEEDLFIHELILVGYVLIVYLTTILSLKDSMLIWLYLKGEGKSIPTDNLCKTP